MCVRKIERERKKNSDRERGRIKIIEKIKSNSVKNKKKNIKKETEK